MRRRQLSQPPYSSDSVDFDTKSLQFGLVTGEVIAMQSMERNERVIRLKLLLQFLPQWGGGAFATSLTA